ncbi:11562_t:CDS:1, partial [Cetraspora pellucida]
MQQNGIDVQQPIRNLQNQLQQRDRRLYDLIRQSEIQLETVFDRMGKNINSQYAKTNENIFTHFN